MIPLRPHVTHLIGESCHPHRFRDTFAVSLLPRGVSVSVFSIAAFGSEMTRGFYVHPRRHCEKPRGLITPVFDVFRGVISGQSEHYCPRPPQEPATPG